MVVGCCVHLLGAWLVSVDGLGLGRCRGLGRSNRAGAFASSLPGALRRVMYRSPDEQSREHTGVYFSTSPHWIRLYGSVASAALALVVALTLAACVEARVVGSFLAGVAAALTGGATYLRLSRKTIAAVLNPTAGTLHITDQNATIELDALVFARAQTFGECSVMIEFLEPGPPELQSLRSTSVWLGASADHTEKLGAALAEHVKVNLSHRPM